jgi:ATP-binding cassette subfamily B protein IrtA
LLAPVRLDHREFVRTAAVIASALVLGWSCTGVALWITHLANGRMPATLCRRMVGPPGQVALGWYSETTSGAVRKAAQDDIDDLQHLVVHHNVELAGAIVLPVGGLGYLLWGDAPRVGDSAGLSRRVRLDDARFTEKMHAMDAGL